MSTLSHLRRYRRDRFGHRPRRLVAGGATSILVGRDAARLDALAAETGAGTTVADVLDPDAFVRATAEAGTPISGLVYAVWLDQSEADRASERCRFRA